MRNYIVLLLVLFFELSSFSQELPAIYVGTDGPCSGTKLMDLYIACGEGDNTACSAFEKELERLKKNCTSEGIEDKCPEDPNKTAPGKCGCGTPDADDDGDGVLNCKDKCKDEKGLPEDGGCPPANKESPVDPPIPPNEDSQSSGVSCYNWGIYRDNKNSSISFQYGKVGAKPNGCFIEMDYARSLGINLIAGKMASQDYYQIAIPNKGQADQDQPPFYRSNHIYSWMRAERDETNNYDFIMVIFGKTKVRLAKKSGDELLEGFPVSLFKSQGGGLLEKMAIISHFDPTYHILKYPTEKNLKVILRGTFKGNPYLIGIDENGSIYEPIALGNPNASSNLIKALTSGGSIQSPLKEIMDDWYNGKGGRRIIGCVDGGRPGRHPNPKSAWGSGVSQFSGASSDNLIFILSDGQIFGNISIDIKASWYRRVMHFENPYLAMLAVADPYTKIYRVNRTQRIIALTTGAPDNLYFLEVPENDDEPTVKALIKLDEKHFDASKLIQIITNGNRLKPPLNKIVSDWVDKGIEKQIIACVENGNPGRHPNPKAAWSSGIRLFSGSTIDSLNFILSNGEIIGPKFGDIKVNWYEKVKYLENPWLAMLAIADPETSILEVYHENSNGNIVVLVSGDPDNIYKVRGDYMGGIPETKRVIDEDEFDLDERKEDAKDCTKDSKYYEENYKKTIRSIRFDKKEK